MLKPVLFACLWLTLVGGCGPDTPPVATAAKPTATGKNENFILLAEGSEGDHVKRLYNEIRKDKKSTRFRTEGELFVFAGQGQCTTRYDRSNKTWSIEVTGVYGHSETPDSLDYHHTYKNVTDAILIKSIAPLMKKSTDGSLFMSNFGHNLRSNGAREDYAFHSTEAQVIVGSRERI